MSAAQENLKSAAALLKSAEAEYDSIVQQAEAMKAKAKAAMDNARKLHAEAMEAADRELPQCTIVTREFNGKDQKRAGVIVRKTGKSIFVRRLGVNEEPDQYRQSKWNDGEWWPYPKPKGYQWTHRFVRLPESGA